ncbi:MAG: DNA mismatch repair protein MutS [Limnochordia bacterium]|jgi:DNA mismatch repair protein MutS
MAKLTPMLKQYLEVKKQHPDALLFFRLGDFYEMFGEDAEIGARELSITLTSREAGKGRRLPMCGVPHHAADRYVATLVGKGYKVAICEQMEDPKTAKGVVHREVVRLVTPGTVTDDEMLEAKSNNYLAAISKGAQGYGLAYTDITTGEFVGTECTGSEAQALLVDEIARLQPAEVLLAPELEDLKDTLQQVGEPITFNICSEDAFSYDRACIALMEQFQCSSLIGFGCERHILCTSAAGAVLDYLHTTQKTVLSHLQSLRIYSTQKYMVLDPVTRRNLELTSTLRTDQKQGSLLGVLDETMTAMGGRVIRQWLDQPSMDLAEINGRLEGVEEFVNNGLWREQCRHLLRDVYDLERLVGKVGCGSANARDLIALKESLEKISPLKELLANFGSPLIQRLQSELDELRDVVELLEASIEPDPPTGIKEGNLIRTGYHPEIDRLRRVCREGKGWIAALEQEERARTGIKSLKVGFNRVFGYYIEVTKANLAAVPPDYQRKQTLANAERYITPALKEKENLILGAEERVTELEYQVFTQIRAAVAREGERIQRTARAVAQLDVLCSLAFVAIRYNFVRPEIDDGTEIIIKGGRHLIVESCLEDVEFVPNDTHLDTDVNRIIILTGPNMAGKSTYLRQVALIVLLAQMGSFVPAASARIGLVDRIFTRVGAVDDLGTGQSTFMVEMTELANILVNATPRSLIIIDELGRGTSTYDGMAISQAAIEHIHNKVKARAIVSTHYHELTQLEDMLPCVKNYQVLVEEKQGRIVFLYSITRGGTDRSYGINVARMAGVPRPVVQRALQLLGRWELPQVPGQMQLHELILNEAAAVQEEQSEILAELSELRINELTPLQALMKLAAWQGQLKGGNKG